MKNYAEELRYARLPRTDRKDNRAAEAADYEYGKKYGEVVLAASLAPFEAIAEQVDEIYQGLGVTVTRGTTYAGEDPTYISLPAEIA